MSMDYFYEHVERASIRRSFDRSRLQFATFGDSSVQQSAKDECDINNIMRQYERTGLLSHVNRYQGDYGDFTDVVDYRTACDVVRRADEMFSSLPASVRANFDNDPSRFLSFVDDPANSSKLVELGLSRVRQPSDTDRVVDAIKSLNPSPGSDNP